MAFHRHIYDCDWHFSSTKQRQRERERMAEEGEGEGTRGGSSDGLQRRQRRAAVATATGGRSEGSRWWYEGLQISHGPVPSCFYSFSGAWKKVETNNDYDEYCHYVAGLVGLGLPELFHASGLEDLAPDSLSNSMGLFLQKTNIIRDYLEDINEIPKSRMFWPRQIWSKYVNKLEDLKHEENSVKAGQCLNDMVTNALIHVDDFLKYLLALRDPAIFRFCAFPQVMAIGTLALCYNNIEVFRGVVKMRRGLTAKVIDQTRTMSDVYGASFDFSCMLKSKVNNNDPNATKTLNRLEAVLKTCRDSGTLNKRKSYIIRSEPSYNSALMAILFAYLSANRPNNL